MLVSFFPMNLVALMVQLLVLVVVLFFCTLMVYRQNDHDFQTLTTQLADFRKLAPVVTALVVLNRAYIFIFYSQ